MTAQCEPSSTSCLDTSLVITGHVDGAISSTAQLIEAETSTRHIDAITLDRCLVGLEQSQAVLC
jgi:hypothetical protein